MIHISDKLKKAIKLSTVILVLAIVIAFAIFSVMKYEVEGEKEVPFKLGKIIVISSATSDDVDNSEQQGEDNNQVEDGSVGQTIDEQQQQETESYIWNKKVIQTNDVYIYLDKNTEYEESQSIKSVKIENIKMLQNVKAGKIQVYMPNSLDDAVYKYINEFLVNSTLTYTGAEMDNKNNLQIGNQGGCVCLSFANVGLDQYKSNDDQEIQQGAAILEKMNVSNSDLKFKVAFDLVVEVQGMTYRTNIVLDMPVDELVGQKETHTEITEFEDVVYKR